MPVIWKLFVTDLPLMAAGFVAFAGIGIGLVNPIFIFFILSVFRVLIYKEVNWFMNIEKLKILRK